MDGLDNLKRWLETLRGRPGVKKGLDVPVKFEPDNEKTRKERVETASKLIVQ